MFGSLGRQASELGSGGRGLLGGRASSAFLARVRPFAGRRALAVRTGWELLWAKSQEILLLDMPVPPASILILDQGLGQYTIKLFSLPTVQSCKKITTARCSSLAARVGHAFPISPGAAVEGL